MKCAVLCFGYSFSSAASCRIAPAVSPASAVRQAFRQPSETAISDLRSQAVPGSCASPEDPPGSGLPAPARVVPACSLSSPALGACTVCVQDAKAMLMPATTGTVQLLLSIPPLLPSSQAYL